MFYLYYDLHVSTQYTNNELRRHLGIKTIEDVMRRSHGHVERKNDADYVRACTRLVVEWKAPVGRPRKTWQNTVSADMRLLKVDPQDAHDRMKWSAIGWSKGKPGSV